MLGMGALLKERGRIMTQLNHEDKPKAALSLFIEQCS